MDISHRILILAAIATFFPQSTDGVRCYNCRPSVTANVDCADVSSPDVTIVECPSDQCSKITRYSDNFIGECIMMALNKAPLMNREQFLPPGHTRSCHTGDAVPICIESSRNHQTNCFCDGDLCNDASPSVSYVGMTMFVVAAFHIFDITWF